jgi:FkbM family methyltransferase
MVPGHPLQSTRGAIFPYEAEIGLKEAFFAGVNAGYFVEVGANDPQVYSETWHLEQRGWTGVLIEPQPDLAEKIRQCRTAKVYAVACSSPANHGTTMVLNLAGAHTSLEPGHHVFGMQSAGTLKVPVTTLDRVLTEAAAPVPVDYVSIDVEGHEIEVLAGFDLERWRPRLIMVEDHAQDLRLHRSLTARGYKWVRRTRLNGWYVPAHSDMRIPAYGRLQFVRKYYLGLPFRRARDRLRRLRERLRRRPMS